MKRLVLFVAYVTDDFDAGLTYAAELARLMGKDMVMLVIDNSSRMDRFEKLMTDITFAESNEYHKAEEVIAVDDGDELEGKIKWFREKCSEIGIEFSIHKSQQNMMKAINEFMVLKKGIDMVLLGPSVTEDGNLTSSELNKLVRTASRPVVTMTRQASER